MRALRMVLGSLLWIVSGVVILLGAVLSLTVVLLPLGVPLFLLGKKLMGSAVRLFLPPAVAHPVESGKKSVTDTAASLRDRAGSAVDTKAVRKSAKKRWKKARRAVA